MHEQDTKIKTAVFVPFVLRRGRENLYAATASATGASGAFLPTEAIPDSIERLVLYISLLPMGSPFDALRTKYTELSFATLRSKRLSLPAFFLTEVIPFTAAERVSYASLVRMTC